MFSPALSLYGADHGLHESSGSAVLPDRVKSCTLPEDSQRSCPQVATLALSRMEE